MGNNNDARDITQDLFDPNALKGVAQNNAQVEIFGKVTDEIYSKNRIELKTELNDRQIVAFSRATVFSNKYKRPLLASLVRNLSIYSVSKQRKGRKEFENIAKALNGMAQSDDERSIPDRILGRR